MKGKKKMDVGNCVVQKVTDILVWDDILKSQLIFSVDIKNNVVSVQTSGEKISGLKTTYIIKNSCEEEGLVEVMKIISGLDWNKINAVIYISESLSEIKGFEKKIVSIVSGQCDHYGVNPDYYFSLVPLSGKRHKRIESFIFSLESPSTFSSKIKYFVKIVMIFLNFSESLYEQFVFCFYPRKQ